MKEAPMRATGIAMLMFAALLLGGASARAQKAAAGAKGQAETPKEAPVPDAQAKRDPAEAKGEEAPKVKVERGAGGRKIFRITTGFVIEGRIQKPNAFYVLQRSQINYDWAKLKKDFTPRILESVESSPF
jgi:hypothetical protein